MALSNIGREPLREIIEQMAGLFFILAYVGWVVFSAHLSTILYHPLYCPTYKACTDAEAVFHYWANPGDFLITFGLSIGIWLLYPFLLVMHFFGEMVCGWLKALGLDPRPKQRYR